MQKLLYSTKSILVLCLFLVTTLVTYATVGGKLKKGGASNKSLSIKASTNTFSLRSGYTYKSGKLMQLKPVTTQSAAAISYIAVKQGNTTTFVATKPNERKIPKINVQNFEQGRYQVGVKVNMQ